MRNFLFLMLTGLLFAACSGPGDVAGGGTETETYGIVGTIVNPGGLPAIDATVRIRPLTYLPDDNLPDELDQDYTTDANGTFAVTDMTAGWYGAIARDASGKASYQVFNLQKTGVVNDTLSLPDDTLDIAGTLQGTVRFPETFPLSALDVALQGLDLDMIHVTDSQPDFTLDSIPAGTYTLVGTPAGIMLSLEALEQLGIRVGADSVTVVDTLDLRFLDSLTTP